MRSAPKSCPFIGIPAIIGGYAFGDRLVRLLGGNKLSAEALGYGLSFFRTLLPGLAVMLFGQALSGILQGQGLTKVISLPHFLSMASLSIGFMLFNKLVSTISEDAMNAWTLAGRMDQMVLIPSFAVAGATSITVAQNYGRNLLARVRRIYVINVLLVVSVVGAVAVVYMLIAPLLFSAFSDVRVVVAAAVRQVRWLAPTFMGISVAIISSATFQSTVRPLPALALSVVRMGLVALPIAWFFALVLRGGMTGVYIGVAIGNLLALPLSFTWARRHLGRVTHRSVLPEPEEV